MKIPDEMKSYLTQLALTRPALYASFLYFYETHDRKWSEAGESNGVQLFSSKPE